MAGRTLDGTKKYADIKMYSKVESILSFTMCTSTFSKVLCAYLGV
ncbi:hypothetical protein HMPREF1248_0726 [Coriobacteriaceae bacterium BV3Ac1]|nr:hypothetical protein HMPREF1248_0726 [Coriobacteriaceae bacterium BV3Ac1]